MIKLQKYFDKKANENMKNELNCQFNKEMRITGQTFFESQLQTSSKSESDEEEEDNEARDIESESVLVQKLL